MRAYASQFAALRPRLSSVRFQRVSTLASIWLPAACRRQPPRVMDSSSTMR